MALRSAYHQAEILNTVTAKAALERLENSLSRILKRAFPAVILAGAVPAIWWLFKKCLLNQCGNGTESVLYYQLLRATHELLLVLHFLTSHWPKQIILAQPGIKWEGAYIHVCSALSVFGTNELHLSMFKSMWRSPPRWCSSKESASNAGDSGAVPGWGRLPGGGHSNPLQYSCLENPSVGGGSRATVHRVAKNPARLKWLGMHDMAYQVFLSLHFHVKNIGYLLY